MDFDLVNARGQPTCIRPQGESVVDLTWASSTLGPLVREWTILEGVETLSDHVYVSIDIAPGLALGRRARRWNFRKMDEALYREAVEFAA